MDALRGGRSASNVSAHANRVPSPSSEWACVGGQCHFWRRSRGHQFTGPYAAAKGAILALTKVAANEWGQHNIRVNAISPFALTDSQEPGLGAEWDRYSRMTAVAPMRRGANLSAEIAPSVAFIASDDAGFITGSMFHLDAGMNGLSSIEYTGFPGIYDA